MIEAQPFDFPYDGKLVPSQTALMVIDLQIDFCSPSGYFASMGYDPAPLAAIVPSVNRVIAAARAAGCLIIHTRQGYRADLADMTPYEKWRRKRSGLENTQVLLRSSPGFQLLPELDVADTDVIIDKTCNSSFTYTDLEHVLRSHHPHALYRLHHRCLRTHDAARSLRPQFPVPDDFGLLCQRRAVGA